MDAERADPDGWETVSRATDFETDHLQVVTEEVRSPAVPKPRRWTTVSRKPAAVIAPMTAEGKLILIRQERIPIRSAIWEMPAGQMDHEGEKESAETVALRELSEETGYRLREGGEISSLGIFFSSPGFTDERAELFLARPVEHAREKEANIEGDSILECRAFTPREISRMIATNEIRDANTLAVWARLLARGLVSLGD